MRKRREIVVDQLNRILNERPGSLILDCGCGNGGVLKELKEPDNCMFGVDLNHEFLQSARTSVGGHLSVFQANIECLPFRDDAFDAVCCIGVLSYLPGDETALAEMVRVTRPGGTIILGMPNLFQLNHVLDPYYYLVGGFRYLFRKRARARKPAEAFESHMIRRYRYAKLKNSLNSIENLQCRKIFNVSYGPLSFWRKELFSVDSAIDISEGLKKVSTGRLAKLLGRFANHWVLCLEKTPGMAMECKEEWG